MPIVSPPFRRLLPIVALVAVLGGCGDRAASLPITATQAPGESATTGPDASLASPATASPGASASPSPPGVASPPAERPDLAAVKVALGEGLGGFDAPLFVTSAFDGSGRLFVVEQGGAIRVVRDGRTLPTPFLDLGGRIASGGERGLLGLAFPPGFGAGAPSFFVHYSDPDGNTVISRFSVSASDPDVADPASEQVVLTQEQPYPNHNGGWIGFDRDGMLLIGLGDGGSAGDPENRASNLDTVLGKMLRIDVLGAGRATPYTIPADNPYVGRPNVRAEILHSGLRNPFRSSVDPATGDLWIGDVGQDAWEEIDVAPAGSRGLDFGWRRWEGSHCYDRAAGCDKAGVTMPVTEYSHADGCSVIGGVVYHGQAIPALRGAYLFGDFCSGRLWAIDAGLARPQAPILIAETGTAISSIGVDEHGEVWITDLSGGGALPLVSG